MDEFICHCVARLIDRIRSIAVIVVIGALVSDCDATHIIGACRVILRNLIRPACRNGRRPVERDRGYIVVVFPVLRERREQVPVVLVAGVKGYVVSFRFHDAVLIRIWFGKCIYGFVRIRSDCHNVRADKISVLDNITAGNCASGITIVLNRDILPQGNRDFVTGRKFY